jgi:hypothetical protein
MTMLTIVQGFCERTNLNVPTTVIGTTDTRVRQIRALLEEIGNDMASRGSWQGITFEASLTSAATESQGAIATIASNGFRYIKNQTIWDRTNKLPIWGPVDAQEWQARKALAPTGPRYQFRIRGGLLMINPVPVAGYSWYFEYVSQNWILGANGSTYKQYFTLDTDTILLPETVLLMGLRWKWLAEKGLDYGEAFRMYETQIKDALGRDGGKPVLHMDQPTWQGPRPGVFVSQGSWPL